MISEILPIPLSFLAEYIVFAVIVLVSYYILNNDSFREPGSEREMGQFGALYCKPEIDISPSNSPLFSVSVPDPVSELRVLHAQSHHCM